MKKLLIVLALLLPLVASAQVTSVITPAQRDVSLPADGFVRWNVGNPPGTDFKYPIIYWSTDSIRLRSNGTSPRSDLYIGGNELSGNDGYIRMSTYDDGNYFGLFQYYTDYLQNDPTQPATTDYFDHKFYFKALNNDALAIWSGGIDIFTGDGIRFLDDGVGWDGTDSTTVTVATPSGANTLTLPAETGIVESAQEGTSTLTDASATAFLSFPLADTEFIAGTLVLVTKCQDASNTAVRHDTADFICTNQSDTESCSFQSNLGSPLSLNDGAGTFATHTLGVDTSGTNTVTMTLDVDCSYASITLLEDSWEIEFHQPNWELVTEEN